MLNTLSKLLEIMIKYRLQTELYDRSGFHPHQYDFQQGRSTVLRIVMQTAESFRKSWCVLIVIDVRNAFNTDSHNIIIKKLRDKRISRYLVNIVSGYLRNRAIALDDGETMAVSAGIPQGSMLGPIL